MAAVTYDLFNGSAYIDSLNINMNDLALMRSLSIGWYVEGWAHAFAFCNNCDRYHTVTQGETCHNGGSIMHRTNAMTNYLYIPDPVMPILSPQLDPAEGADEGQAVTFFILDNDDDDDDETIEGEATEEVE
jgi:hypothetical protein